MDQGSGTTGIYCWFTPMYKTYMTDNR